MARPTLPDDERRGDSVRVRVNDEEKALLKRAAKKAGQNTMANWARKTLLEAAGELMSGSDERHTDVPRQPVTANVAVRPGTIRAQKIQVPVVVSLEISTDGGTGK